MNNKIYKITLADGTVIDNLTLNGNNYISKEVVDPSIFAGNCSPTVINDGTRDDIHSYMELVQVTNVNDEFWIVLRDISTEELSKIKLQSNIEYIAMMAGVEL